jgi:long-chain acyl-CoA synthetase
MEHFYELVAAAVDEFPDRVAIEVQHRDRLEQVSYARLREMAERTAAWLAMIGLDAGQRAAILADNDAAWCAAYLGILRRGAIAVPLDTNYKSSQVRTLLVDSGARVLFTTAKHLTTVLGARAEGAELTIVLLHGSDPAAVSFEAMVGGNLPAPPVPPCSSRPSDPAVILYTSGTTSDPKGVVLTHANLLAERDGAFAVVRVDSGDAVLGVLPLFHALAQMANLLLPLSIGARVVFLETINTTELLRALKERGITVFACVPQFFYLIHQRVQGELDKRGALARGLFRSLLTTNRVLRRVGWNAGSWLFRRVHAVMGRRMRIMVTGGSKFDSAIGADLSAMGFNILQAYGLTETSGAATLMRPGDSHLEAVGHPLPGVEVRIGAPEAGDEGATDGEVLIRGPVVMQGYFNRADATAAALDAEGWLHTGDLGRLDPEGRLLITGRRKELIVLSSGKNIYPEEIEAVYRRSAFIREICVLGLGRPGEPAAERLYAVVVPDEELLRERKIANVGDLLRFEIEGASVYLPHHKRVLGYEIWREPLPRTTTGKIRRFEIERRVRDREASATTPGGPPLSDDDRAWLERPELGPILAAIRKAARSGATVVPEANLELDLGLDSMERVELLTSLEQRFGADIPEGEMQRLYTVRELAESVLAHSTGDGGEESAAWGALLSPSQIDSKALDASLRPHGLISIALFAAIKFLRVVFRPGVRVEVSGLEQLPATGPLIISPNHQSYLDPFVLLSALPLRIARQLFFVGATEYFESPLTRWLAQQVSLVPVDPDAGLVPAMQAGAYGLGRGRILVLFPEGERSIDGSVKHFKKGAAILSRQLQVPIAPVAINGLFAIWPRNRPLAWRRLLPGSGARVRLTFGTPIRPAAAVDSAMPPAEAYDAITAELRRRVEGMWKATEGGAPAS